MKVSGLVAVSEENKEDNGKEDDKDNGEDDDDENDG